MPDTGNPTVEQEDLFLLPGALTGWKAARLAVDLDGSSAALLGVWSPEAYGTHDVARCKRSRTHVPPEPGCACGFYAWRRRELALELVDPRSPALATVALNGRYDEYELGFVAACQRVERVQVAPVCRACFGVGELTTASVLVGSRPASTRGLAPVEPACEGHGRGPGPVVTLEALELLLGVRVGWLPMDAETALHLRVALARDHAAVRPRGTVADLAPGGVGHVYQQALRGDPDGRLWVSATASLVRPLAREDVPVHRRPDGSLEVLLSGMRLRPVGLRVGEKGYEPAAAVGTPLAVV